MARHSKNAETGTMQRRRLKAARKLGFSVIVSARVIDRHYGATDDRRIGASLKS